MLVINSVMCRLSSFNPEDPSKNQPDILQYHVSDDAPLHYHRATCWIPMEQIFTRLSWNQDLYPLPIKIQVFPPGLAEQNYDVYIFHNGNLVYPQCVWPPPLQQAPNPITASTSAVGQSYYNHPHPNQFVPPPAQVPNHSAAYTESLIQLTSPGAKPGVPWLFYAPGSFAGGIFADAADMSWTPPHPQPRPFAPRVSSSLKTEISCRSPPNGVLTVIVTSPGVQPILPNQEKGHNLATFSFCYAPTEKLLSRK